MVNKIKHCPSCGGTQIEVAGNKILCRACEITFTVTDEGARATDIDPLTKDRQRLDRIEKDVAGLKQKQQGGNGADDEPEPTNEPEPDETEDEKEPDGFIV